MSNIRLPLVPLLAFVAASSQASVLTLEPVADTYIASQSSMTNYGSVDPLKYYTQIVRIPMFRFDFSAIPSSAVVYASSITITVASASNGTRLPTELAFYDLAENFVESQANDVEWASGQPWIGSPGLNQYQDYNALPFQSSRLLIYPSTAPASYTADVGSLIQTLRARGQTQANVVLMQPPASMGGNGTIYSREDPTPANRPHITISYSLTAPIARVPPAYLFTMAQWNHNPVSIDGSASSLPDGSKTGLTYAWTVNSAAPGSALTVGQLLGTSSILSFNPDLPGTYVLQLAVTNGSTGEVDTALTMINVGVGPHPRLQIDANLLSNIKALAAANDPRWTRFIGMMNGSGPKYNIEMSYMLAYLVTGDTTYFDTMWSSIPNCLVTDKKGNCAGGIYVNGVDNSAGYTTLLDLFTQAGYQPPAHAAGFIGGNLMAKIALVYDWGYGTLTATQRQDVVNWLNGAVIYDHLYNAGSKSYFRNDGAAITNGVGSAAYGTLGDSTMSVTWLGYFHDRWAQTTQALNLMGTGMGEGNEYGEAPTADALIQVANAAYFASGEDLFESSPWFKKRLEYDTYSVYPSTFGGPGAPYPNGWPGLFAQMTVGFGDGRWGTGWTQAPMRANGLILCRRYAGYPECNDWSYMHRQPALDQTITAGPSVIDLMYWTPPPALTQPSSLSFIDQTSGRVYIRSDWGRDSTWISIWAGPHFDTHAHLKKGAYEVFKHRFLLPDTGNYDQGGGGFGGGHFWGWYHRTVSSNGLLIGDPNELVQGLYQGIGCNASGTGYQVTAADGSKLCVPNDGGQRSMDPLGLGAGDVDKYLTYNQIYNTARIAYYNDNGSVVSVVADITNAYNNPQYTTPGNSPKVNRVWRNWVYLRQADLLFVGDVVDAVDPSFGKKSLLHAADRIVINGSSTTITPGGEYVFNGQTDATIVVSNSENAQLGPNPMTTWDLLADDAFLKVRTLFPNNFQIRMVGGRDPSATEHIQVYTTSSTVAKMHYHTHIKDFFVHDFSEGVYPNHKSAEWMPADPQEDNTTAFEPAYVGGFGRWRMEVEPTAPSNVDYFLNVMKPTMDGSAALPTTTKYEDANYFGVSVPVGAKVYKILFNKNTLGAPTVTVTGGDTMPPAQPTGLKFVSASTMTWLPVTQNADGSAISDLAGYRVFTATNSLLGRTTAQVLSDPLVTKNDVPAPTTSYQLSVLVGPATYFFRLSAYDTSGNFSGLNIDSVTHNDAQLSLFVPAPVVSVTISPSSATLTAGATLQFTATVTGTANTGVTWSATTGTVSGTGLYTAPSATYTLTAIVKATSVADTTKSASATVTINPSGGGGDAIPPTIAVASPADGSLVSGKITVSGTASDNVAVASVQVAVDNGAGNLASGTTSWTYGLNTTSLADGVHSLKAIATDSSGNVAVSSITIVVDNTAPVLSAIAATGISSFSAVIGWNTNEPATTQVNYGTTTSYGQSTALDQNLVSTHAASLGGLLPATLYHYRARSKDGAGNLAVSGDFTFTTSSGVDNIPPTVSISSPTNNSFVTKGPVNVIANASDNVAVAKVQFLADGVQFAQKTSPPYAATWDTSGLKNNSSHVLTAIATDTSGNQSSASITVTVRNRINANAALPGLRASYVYPSPAGPGQTPVIRASLGLVDSVELTIYDMAGRAAHSVTLPGAPTGVDNSGEYYYDLPWTGTIPSGVYSYVIHGKVADGTIVRARGRFAVVR